MLPSISATVNNLYSLPGFPFTVWFSVFSLYMKRSARIITFGVTWVVDKIKMTHFLNELVGIESGPSRLMGDEY